MKKILAITLLALFTTVSKAQQQEELTGSITPSMRFGYVHMAGFGDVKGGLAGEIKADLRHQITDKFGISIGAGYELLFSSKSNNDKYKFGFISFPLMLNFQTSPHITFQIGGELKIMTDAKRTYNGYDSHISEYYRTVSWYIPAGLTYTFDKPFVVGLHFDMPVNNLIANESDSYSGVKFKSDAKLTWITASFGYRFDF